MASGKPPSPLASGGAATLATKSPCTCSRYVKFCGGISRLAGYRHTVADDIGIIVPGMKGEVEGIIGCGADATVAVSEYQPYPFAQETAASVQVCGYPLPLSPCTLRTPYSPSHSSRSRTSKQHLVYAPAHYLLRGQPHTLELHRLSLFRYLFPSGCT